MNPREAAPFESITFLELHGPPDLPALWLRYTWCDHARREARLWAVAWVDGAPVGETRSRPLSELRRWDPEDHESTAGRLTHHRATGDTGRISWDLALDHAAPPHDLVPPSIARFGRTYRTLGPDLRATGQVTVDGRTFAIDGARGVMGHIHGRRNRVASWGWCHAAGLDGLPEARFEALCARLGPAAAPLPPLTSARLDLGDRSLVFTGLTDLLRTSATLGVDGFSLRAEGPRGWLEASVTLGPPAAAALLEYRDDHDRPVWCRNSPDAQATLVTAFTGESPRVLHGRLTAEIGTRSRRPGRRTAPSRW